MMYLKSGPFCPVFKCFQISNVRYSDHHSNNTSFDIRTTFDHLNTSIQIPTVFNLNVQSAEHTTTYLRWNKLIQKFTEFFMSMAWTRAGFAFAAVTTAFAAAAAAVSIAGLCDRSRCCCWGGGGRRGSNFDLNCLMSLCSRIDSPVGWKKT